MAAASSCRLTPLPVTLPNIFRLAAATGAAVLLFTSELSAAGHTEARLFAPVSGLR